MQITDPINNPRLFIERTRADALQQLRPGQTLSARVVSPVEKGVAQLDLGGTKLPVKTALDLVVGQQIKLQVMKGGNSPEFQLIREMGTETQQLQALKRILPKQLPLHRLLDGLQSVTVPRPGPGHTSLSDDQNSLARLVRQLLPANLPAGSGAGASKLAADPSLPVRNLSMLSDAMQTALTSQGKTTDANTLVRQLGALLNPLGLDGKPVSGQGLRQAIENSGLFLEAQLAAGNGGLAKHDFKARLLQLILTLQQVAGQNPAAMGDAASRPTDAGTALQHLAARLFAELQSMAEGALARVQMHQLASLPQDENGQRQVWQFELPLQHAQGHDNFHIQIEKETGQQADEPTRWSVTLNFEIPPAGPISARLSLVGDIISSHFTAAYPEGVSRIEQALPTLTEALTRAGLKVGKLTTRQGVPSTLPAHPLSPVPLLDERA